MTESNKQQLYQRLAWAYFILALLSLCLTINYPLLREEGNYTSLILDMMLHHHWLQPYLAGTPYPRPPLGSWLAVPWVYLFGYKSVLIVIRVLTVIYTSLTALILVWFVKNILRPSETLLPILSGCLFLSGGVLFMRGWLAYADPLFSLLVFSSTVLLYRSLKNTSLLDLTYSLLLIFAAALAKEPVAYVFYAISGLVMVSCGVGTRFAFRLRTIIVGLLGLAIPYFIWRAICLHFQVHADASGEIRMMTSFSLFFKRLGNFTGHFFMRYNLIFLVVIAAAFTLQRASILQRSKYNVIKFIILLNMAPYVFISGGINVLELRYVLPLIPWLAIFSAQLIIRARPLIFKTLIIVLYASLLWKYILGGGRYLLDRGLLLPVKHLDGAPAARDIKKQIGEKSVCAKGFPWDTIGLVQANLNINIAEYGHLVENYAELPNSCKYRLESSPLNNDKWNLVKSYSWYAKDSHHTYLYRSTK